MFDISAVLPLPGLIAHLTVSALTLCLCILSFAAIVRTKKTPYPTKLFSLGLLVYDSLFIISASGGKFFPHEENFVFRQLSRGFQVAALIIVVFMSFERLFVLGWPMVFLRVGTRERIRKVCVTIIILSFLQFILFQGLVCYARGKLLDCKIEIGTYFLVLLVLGYTGSIALYIKIFRIIRNRSVGMGMTSLKENKGTGASFVYLINNVVTGSAYVGLTLYFAFLVANGTATTGQVTNITDAVYLVNCICDPLIYVVWFKEVRMEILNMFSKICCFLKPTVEKMRKEVFNIEKIRNAPNTKLPKTG